MTRILAILACVGLLIQLLIKQAYSTGPIQPDEYLIVGLAYAAPGLSLIALVRRGRKGFVSDLMERLTIEEAVRLERARAALAELRKTDKQ